MLSTSFWQRIPLRVQGIIYNSLPLVAVLITAAFAYFSNLQREKMEMSLNRHFEMVENLVDMQMAVVNAESGLGGYLLTRDPAQLQAVKEATTQVPEKLARVRTLMQSIPKPNRRAEKLARLDAIQRTIEQEMGYFSAMETTPPPAGTEAASRSDIGASIKRNHATLDALIQQLNDLRGSEQGLLSRRIDEIRTVRQRDYLLIFLSVFVGLASRAVALYFFHKRVVRRVRQLTENVRSLRDGASLVHEPSEHADDIGELERELARASELLAVRRIDS